MFLSQNILRPQTMTDSNNTTIMVRRETRDKLRDFQKSEYGTDRVPVDVAVSRLLENAEVSQ